MSKRPTVDEPDLGPCCCCESVGPTVRNLITLHQRAPSPHTGWGCLVCGLPADGALAVVCDKCIHSDFKLRFAIRGYPRYGLRIPIEDLDPERFDHDASKHPEREQR
jgi:hypothetical protein